MDGCRREKGNAITRSQLQGSASPFPSLGDTGEAAVTSRAGLREASDNELLARLHPMPHASSERAAICEVLVERYAYLVRACVRPYRGSPEPAEDLMQVGYVGLLKAINNFNPRVGDSLPAYAAPCVSGEIKRHFRDKRWQIHVRRPLQELLLEIRAVSGELAQERGHAPADHELAALLGATEDDIREARKAAWAFSAASLDAPLSDQEDAAVLADVLGENDRAVEHAIDMEAVRTHLGDLPEREQHILNLRFYGNLTQIEIGQRLGISQMHVSRLLARALAYLRDQLTSEPGRNTPGKLRYTGAR
jgi:RNA polymerase sigma-B factor